MKKKVILAMSGGVDSSVALQLLLDQGYEVHGITMQNGYLSEQEIARAQKAANHFKISWEVVFVEKEFEKMVIKPFIRYYEQGLTPNPCVLCNRAIKFGFLFDVMQEKFPLAFYATGHYAQIEQRDNLFFLKEAVDCKKDQSYFLGTIRPEILSKLIFPIGGYYKSEIIEIAKKTPFTPDIINESQDICFIHDQDYALFLEQKGVVEKCGKIVNQQGDELGSHRGIYHYTVGQRRGLGITATERLFVKEMDPTTNTIVLAPLREMYSNSLSAFQLNRFVTEKKVSELSKKMLKCRVKSGSQMHDCHISVEDDELTVFFSEQLFAITPGQLCVVYNNEGLIMISGIIKQKYFDRTRNNQVDG